MEECRKVHLASSHNKKIRNNPNRIHPKSNATHCHRTNTAIILGQTVLGFCLARVFSPLKSPLFSAFVNNCRVCHRNFSLLPPHFTIRWCGWWCTEQSKKIPHGGEKESIAWRLLATYTNRSIWHARATVCYIDLSHTVVRNSSAAMCKQMVCLSMIVARAYCFESVEFSFHRIYLRRDAHIAQYRANRDADAWFA